MLSVIYKLRSVVVLRLLRLGIAIEILNIPQEKCFLTCAKMPVSLQADIMTFFIKHKR